MPGDQIGEPTPAPAPTPRQGPEQGPSPAPARTGRPRPSPSPLCAGRLQASRLRALLAAVWEGAVAARIRDGRLRDLGWPPGLRAAVGTGLGLVVAAGLVSLASSWLRRGGELAVPLNASFSLPDGLVWLLGLFLVVAVALVQTAGLHGPWWLRLLALVLTVLVMGSWGLRTVFLVSAPAVLAVQIGLILAMIGLTVARWRAPFAWWEFPVVLGVVGASISLALADLSYQFGGDSGELAPDLIRGTMTSLYPLVLPAAVAAGTAVAELTVGLVLVGVARAGELPGRRWPYGLLAVVAALLVLQLVRQVLRRDPVAEGWLAFVPALIVAVALAGVAGLVFGRSRAAAATGPVSDLPEELGRVAFPLGAALVGLAVPLIVVATAVTIVAALDPSGVIARSAVFDRLSTLGERVDVVRLVLSAVLVVLAVRAARRGRVGPGLLFGCIAVTLAAQAMRALTGHRWAVVWDADALNLLAGAAGLALTGWFAVLGRLTVRRALAGSALLAMCLLYSIRQVLGDPVGELIGYSGIAVVLFGVVWDFLTASGWGNRDGRRFPRPTRVLLVLANTALLMVVIAYGSLVRDLDQALDIEGFVDLGDRVLGTGLLAAAYLLVARLLIEDRPVS